MILRDQGLQRRIGPFALAAAVVNGVVGAGIFGLPAAMAQAAGTLAPFAYLLCAMAMGLVVLCFAEAGSRMPTSGGVYGYVADAFGPMAGFLCGMLTWTASVLACGGIASALAATVGTAIPMAAAGPGRAGIILAAIGGIAWVNLRGVRAAAGLVSVATLVKLVPLVGFVALGLLPVPAGVPPPVAHAASAGLGQGVILAVFAFSGMETVLGASGEVANPHRSLPRALFAAMGFVLVLYVGIQLVAQRLLGADLAHATAPLAQAAARIGPVAGAVLTVGAGLSMLGWIGSDILGAPRILFAFARDGLLPTPLGHVSVRAGTPDVAILVHAGLAAALALSGSFTPLIVASTLNTAALYFLGCAAAWVLHRRGTQTFGVPVSFAAMPAVAAGAMLCMAVLVGVAPGVQVLGLAAVIAASCGLFVAMRALRGD